MEYIAIPLNALMALCYNWTGSYLMAIIVFTLLTKVILFPISCWMQRESIKMVQLTPDLNALKVKYYGDKDTVAEETQKIYKQKKYHPIASTIPMIIQLVLLMGVIAAVKAMLGGDTTSIYAQIPSQLGGVSLLMPVAAGVAALLLGVGQNKLNPLQKEQSKREQWMTNGLSILISLSLGAFVTVGVCVYWIASNLFSILNQAALNLVIRPAKYIDYDALHKSQKELESINAMSAGVSKEDKKREKADYKRFFSVANKHLVFYSESSGFYKYYRATIAYLLSHTNIIVHYVTSDPADQVFEVAKTQPRIRPYYIGEKKLITLFMKMDADMVIMTMPDLQNFHIKRSYVRKDVEYVYVPHGLDSLNLTMRTGSVDHYDAVLCVGPNQKEEIRKTEEVYNLPSKKLVECGYMLLDDMRAGFSEKVNCSERPVILIAPSWQEANIMDSCIDELLTSLRHTGYRIIVRPHPQYVKHREAQLNDLKARYAGTPQVEIQTDFASNSTVFRADLLITDWSGIAYEYAYTTCRPVLFVNTPMKVMNPEYERIGVVPINISIRKEIGREIALEDVGQVNTVVEEMIARRGEYQERIRKLACQNVYNLGQSAQCSAKFILSELNKKKGNTQSAGASEKV